MPARFRTDGGCEPSHSRPDAVTAGREHADTTQVAGSRPSVPPGAPDPSGRRANVVALTAARVGTAKRGLAAGLGRAITRAGVGTVCVLDADVVSRDVGVRLGVDGPTAADVLHALRSQPGEADADALFASIARDADGCAVVPLGTGHDALDPAVHTELVPWLRGRVDHLVVDAPVALGTYGRRVDHLIHLVDDLLVATTTQAADVPALLQYLNSITRGRVTGEIPAALEIRVVPTGPPDEDDEVPALARKLRSVPVVDMLPQLWGRNAGLLDDEPELPDTLESLVRELVS
jgi:Mrp family chromosome partitioning ATPase